MPKTKEKMPAASSGCSTTHTAPNAVWRYRNLTSRIANDAEQVTEDPQLTEIDRVPASAGTHHDDRHGLPVGLDVLHLGTAAGFAHAQ